MSTVKTVSLRLLIPILICLPPAAVLRIILAYGQSIPWMDSWGLTGRPLVSYLRGMLSLSDFFQPHNESVRAFTGLIWFLLALPGWNARVEMIITWMVIVAVAVILCVLLRRTLSESSLATRTIFALMVLFLFHPHGTRHWITGLNLENATVIMFLTAGLQVNSSSTRLWLKYLLTACFSLAATFSFSNGLILWFLICPALFTAFASSKTGHLRQRIAFPFMIYLAAGLICLFTYISMCAASPYPASHVPLDFENPLDISIFLLRWLGAPFQVSSLPWAGPCIASLFLLLLLISLLSFIRRTIRGEEAAAFLPWLLLAAYSLITGCGVALARHGNSAATALAPRYFLHEVLLPIALLPLSVLVLRSFSGSRGRKRLPQVLYRAFTGLLALFCTISVLSQWTRAEETAKKTERKRARGTVALSFINVVPDNTELVFLNPFTAPMKARARICIRHGILDLPLHPPLPIGPYRPKERRIKGLKLHLREEGSILVTGVCPTSHAGGGISHILLSSFHDGRHEKGFAVITPQLSQHSGQMGKSTKEKIHFRTHVSAASLEPGRHQIKAWVYDESTRVYTPLVREWRMDKGDDGLAFILNTRAGAGKGGGRRHTPDLDGGIRFK